MLIYPQFVLTTGLLSMDLSVEETLDTKSELAFFLT